MARRFVYFQGAAVLPVIYPVKILLDRGLSFGRLRYWVGGWGGEAADFTQIDTGAGFPTQLYGITATGPGPNDWIVSGRVQDGSGGGTQRFYDHTGLIGSYVAASGGIDVWAAYSGHFIAGYRNQVNGNFFWATPSESGIEGFTDGNLAHGFVLPGVREAGRLQSLGVAVTMRTGILPNLDLTYSVISGQFPLSPNPIGNPWIVSSGGTFTRLLTNLNSAIRQSDLIGTTLYARNVFLTGSGPWANPLTVTPHSINPTTGVVTSQSPKEVPYLLPSGRGGSIIDSSIWLD